jgi:hypothetical protein
LRVRIFDELSTGTIARKGSAMGRKRFTPEQIIHKLREAEVEMAKGQVTAQVCKKLGVTEQMRDELLNGELFSCLAEAKVLVEQWRKTYNHVRPHSALGYRSLAPEASDQSLRTSCHLYQGETFID